MRRILAIAALAVRAAIRSRLVICLLLLLLGSVAGLPLTIQDDGTPEGHVRIVLGYTMGFAGVLLSLSALWSGALSISREVADKQIQMLCSKPVHRLEIWLGKWLGLTAVHAALLALSAAATFFTLQHNLASPRFTEAQRAHLRDEVLAAWRPQQPPPPDVEQAARAALQERLASGALPANTAPDQALQALRQELTAQALAVPPGGRLSWPFTLPADLPTDAELRLKYRFSTSRLGMLPVRGAWFAGAPGAESVFRIAVTQQPAAAQSLRIPAAAARGDTRLVISYVNDDPDPITVVFPPGNGVELHLPAGAFPANFARAVLLLLCRLALFTAIGITAGALFSTPVAALMSLAAVLFIQTGGYVASLANQERLSPWSLAGDAAPGLLDHALRALFRLLHLLVAPLQTGAPMDRAATGLVVEPAAVALAFAVQVLLYGGVLALLATLALNRRELALPHT